MIVITGTSQFASVAIDTADFVARALETPQCRAA